jgi:hypothetical protein
MWGGGPPATYDIPSIAFVFSNIPAFNAQPPLFSITFPLSRGLGKTDPLFSTTFPYRSFIFKELLFSFSSGNGLAVHLRKGGFLGFWPRLGLSREWISGSGWHCSIAFPGGHDGLHGFNLLC